MAELTDLVRVLVVDDDALVSAGLTPMLDGAHGIVVLMDIRMPRMDGIAATRRLQGRPRDHPGSSS